MELVLFVNLIHLFYRTVHMARPMEVTPVQENLHNLLQGMAQLQWELAQLKEAVQEM